MSDDTIEVPVEQGDLTRVPYTELDRPAWRQLSMDIADGLVFGTWNMRDGLAESCISTVFMPLVFGAFADMEEQLTADPRFPRNKETPVALYEYLTEAGPRSVNGYPCFMSCRILIGKDLKKVLRLSAKFSRAKQTMVAGQ